MLSALTCLPPRLISRALFSPSTATRRPAVSLIAALACLVCLLVTPVRAQDKQYTENQPDQSLRSDARVDPSTLGMSIGVPLGGAQGRAGASLPISLRYSSKQWRIAYTMSWQSYINYNTWTRTEFSENATAGWTSSLEPPRIEYTGQNQLYDAMGAPISDDLENSDDYACYIRRINVHLSDGSSHELRKDDATQCFYRSDPNFQYDFTGNFYAVDGSRTRFDADAGVLYLPDGGRYLFGAYDGMTRYRNHWVEGRRGTAYIDRNGNVLNYNSSTRTWTDALGRSFGDPLPVNPSVGDQSYTIPGVGGHSLTYTLRWRLLADVMSTPGDPLRYTSNKRCLSPNNYQMVSPYLFTTSYPVHVCADSSLFNPVVLAEIVLPTGQSYQYKYNPWGEIDKVIQPGGGYERFRYAAVPTLGDASHPYDQANRGVVEHWISPSGTGAEESSHRWQYSLERVSGNAKATITTPDGTRSERLMYASAHSPTNGFDNPLAGMAFDERMFNSANQMLRRTLTKWSTVTPAGSAIPRDPHITKTVVLVLDTGGDALASTTTMAHDGDLNAISTSAYDYASVASSTAQTAAIDAIPTGALVRTEETTYLVNDAAISASVRQSYRDRNLVGLPTSMRVNNAAGTVMARSAMSYDQGALVNCPGIVGHDGSYHTGFTVRGNLSATTVYEDAANWGGARTTSRVYDIAGNVRQTTDPRGNTLTVDYADAFSDQLNRNTYAYPTHSTSPVPDPTNERGANTPLVSATVYDFWSGKTLSTTDANNKTTTYQFNDALDRPSRVDRPDGGWTTYWYDRNVYGDYIGTRTSINATQNTEGYQFFDGLGRRVRSFAYDGSQWSTTDTEYDAMGRVKRVSNPYLTGGSGTPINPSGNWTTTAYDALGRVQSVTTPDNAQVTTAYSGNTVTVTDQTGKRRKSVTDALGRLTTVYEDPHASGYTGLNHQTNYTYDVLGNLRKVEQGEQLRYFMYDSLSRPIRAKNPEQGVHASLATAADPVSGNTQWSLAYTYDANGNMASRTDARGVSATYGYDALNRLTSTSYSDSTPYVGRVYDKSANGRGRFAWHWTNTSAHTVVHEYDALGRVTAQSQHFWINNGWGQAFTTRRAYNRAGSVTWQQYPSEHTVNYDQFDVAGRLKNFTGNLGDGALRTYATGITYDEASRLSREQFGTNTPLYHKQRYNVRGQLWDVRLSTLNDADNWNRGMVVNLYGSGDFVTWGTSGTNNNGNVLRSHHYVPGDEQISNWTVNYQDYAYDALNRLSSIGERRLTSAGVDTPQFSQVYDYDRWGNRQINAAATTDGLNEKQFAIDTGTNRLGVPSGQLGTMSYDSAGNLTDDTYTGAGARNFDAENRMTSAVIGINSSAYYTYDADGKRVRRQTPNGTVWQVYGMDGELVAEYAASAVPTTPQKEYGYRNGELLITAAGGGSSSSAAATFIRSDTTTQGSWKGAYGSEGYNLAGDGASYPAYAQVSVTGHQSHTWAASTADVRALQKSAQGSTDRIASTWFSPTDYTIDLNLTDGQEHQVALYALDWDANNVRAMRVEARDAATNALLGSQDVTSYSGGQYVVWKLRGHVKLKVVYTGTAGLNATLSGLFFDASMVNVAAASQGATATSSSDYPYGTYNAASTINGDRKGVNWGAGGGWNDATLDAYPDWLEVAFNGTKTINEINVFTCQDNYANPAEPTEAQTFTLYGLTGFEVQYWTGSAWANVLGGSVTGNNKVWRKFTFAAITTQKIRVVINAALASYSRLTEVEAYSTQTATTTNEGVQWLVTDHLGTPRIIADLSGSLAGIKRHDYLPFGEELLAGKGGRTQTQGYAGDNVRQQFTGYERDDETGLDYAQARYFASTQGRFTSVDPLMASARLGNPQTLNRYSYVLNKPMNLIDPNGLSARSANGWCSAESSSCDEEENGSAGLSEYETRLQHQYNAMAATRAIGEGDWETYNDLMAADPTLTAVRSEPQIIFKKVEFLDGSGTPIREAVKSETTGNFKLDVLSDEGPNPRTEMLKIKVTFVSIDSTLDASSGSVSTTNERARRWDIVEGHAGKPAYEFDMGSTTGTVIINVRSKDVEGMLNNPITVKVSATFTKNVWEKGILNQRQSITKQTNIRLFIGKRDDGFK